MSVTYKGNRINSVDSSSRFQVQDCYSIPVCGLCLLQPNCGWCRGSVRCMTKAWCDAEPITEFGAQCPALTRLSRSSAPIAGAESNVTIEGGPFVNSPLLVATMTCASKKKKKQPKNRETETNFVSDCFFRSYAGFNQTVQLATSWLSASQLTVIIPRSVEDRDGEVRIEVFMNGTAYTPSSLSFIYLAPASITNGVSPGTIGGIVAAAAAVIAVLVIALLIMRTRKVGFFSDFKYVFRKPITRLV